MGKAVDKVERIAMTAEFTTLLFYIVLTFKPYTNLKIENKLRQINLIVFQTGNMTTKRNERFFKVLSKQNALMLLLNGIYSKEEKGL